MFVFPLTAMICMFSLLLEDLIVDVAEEAPELELSELEAEEDDLEREEDPVAIAEEEEEDPESPRSLCQTTKSSD